MGWGLFAPLVITTTAALPGPFAGLEQARPPARIETYWQGLPPATDRATISSAVVALKPAPERRIRIAGGRFVMGSTAGEMQAAMLLCSRERLAALCQREVYTWDIGPSVRAEGRAHEVWLSPFEIDATEVTVASYGRCVAAGACAPPAFAPGDARYDQPSFPVTHVRWEDASGYCSWASGRLPTEAEWELAARGTDNRAFPWGNVWNPRLANHGQLADDPTDGRDGFLGLAPVGSFPDGASASGLLNLAGNAAEWVADFYDRDDEQFGYPGASQTNPKGPPFGALGHVIRGGSFRDAAHQLRTAARHAASFAERDTGFRCAADVASRTPAPQRERKTK